MKGRLIESDMGLIKRIFSEKFRYFYISKERKDLQLKRQVKEFIDFVRHSDSWVKFTEEQKETAEALKSLEQQKKMLE